MSDYGEMSQPFWLRHSFFFPINDPKIMKKIIVFFLFSILFFQTGKGEGWSLSTPQDNLLSTALLPYPQKVVRIHGELLLTGLQAYFPDNNMPGKYYLQKELEEINTFWHINSLKNEKACMVEFHLEYSELQSDRDKELYSLHVKKEGIKISAFTFSGFFNALQTLRQLVEKRENGFYLPFCVIEDTPAFEVRGVMLDIGRNYVPVDLIKEIVRKLSYYKINMLHLHLTDDPGWRLESKNYPVLNDSSHFWPTRQPGKFYLQEELIALQDYCEQLNMRVMPEIDMPGHSACFTRATGHNMQSEVGMTILKEVLDDAMPVFRDPWFHLGSDETRFEMENFMPEMIRYVREKGKEVVVWSPGYIPDSTAIRMCWGENEAGYALDKSGRYIDTNGFYVDYMDSQAGVIQVFFQQPCEVPVGNDKALGSIMCVWTDGALSSGQRILEQYPFYPCVLTFAERIWRGIHEKRRDLMAQLPQKGTPEWNAFAEFEERLVYHRNHYFQDTPFAYVKQADIFWRLIGPFDHKGLNDTSFKPEKTIQMEYKQGNTTLRWNDTLVYGGAVQIRDFYTMFNMHQQKYKQNHWPTLLSPSVGLGDGTCYALTYIKSPVEQDVFLMFGINGMWGHSGGYRTERAPEQGSWDFSGGDIWLNDERVAPPHWPFESLPWAGWGKGRIETPLTEEGYFFRPPVSIKLRKGLNKILIRSVFGHWKGDDGQRRWQFCCIPVLWDGRHYKEVDNLEYVDLLEEIK